MTDKQFLQWIHDRLEHVHGENHYFDYMHKLRAVISRMSDEVCSPNVERDAARYRYLREQHWNDSEMAVVKYPKSNVRLGSDCPSFERLDELIDSKIQQLLK